MILSSLLVEHLIALAHPLLDCRARNLSLDHPNRGLLAEFVASDDPSPIRGISFPIPTLGLLVPGLSVFAASPPPLLAFVSYVPHQG